MQGGSPTKPIDGRQPIGSRKRKMRNTGRSSRPGGEQLPRNRGRTTSARRGGDRGPRKGTRDHCTRKCWPWTTAAASVPEGPGTPRETCGRGHPRPQRARGKLYSNETTATTNTNKTRTNSQRTYEYRRRSNRIKLYKTTTNYESGPHHCGPSGT